MNILNPAFAGSENQTTLSLTSRNQWISIENAPKTQVLIFSSPRKKNVGLGLSFISNKYYVESTSIAYVDFSYKLNLTDETKLFFGLKGGASFFKADISSLISTNNISDPTQKAVSSTRPNFGIGALIKSKDYWISFSIPRLFGNNDNNDIYISSDRVHTYFSGGTNIRLTDDFILKPSFISRKVEYLPMTHEVSINLDFKNNIQLGSFYRTNNRTGALLFISLKSFFDIGYAYELNIDKNLSSLGINNHEIFLRIKFDAGNTEIEEVFEE
tara:strand:- start:178 stop:990 length:813 start_codon:yes stop_codon:yes gene_type:complete